ncbi:Crp/Fnr family transcriptional regulator [Siculibacillus lacustris]|uniref:Crp/Fnr family transcriptional regulator n=1 Tax=Siculibacillus lacustris TaxID=1549641 RepID=A0A4Q9VKB7_9HYPH|nr:Crp/Fnr family transcriptional regulator [Siculibacillus lacustris]TBW35813.1 Crp/Fnr family transcriptional regulator [Siculibacillus lacustris]
MSLERDIDLLRNVPFFDGIPSEALRLLAFSADPRDYGDGARLFSAGDVAEGGAIVIDGWIDLLDERENPPRVIERLGPGALIGELALIVETTRSVAALSNGRSRVLAVRRSLFRRMLEEYPSIAVTLHDRIAERLTSLSPVVGRIGADLAAIDRD